MNSVPVTKEGNLKLSTRKVFMLSLIVAFFSIIAHLWESKQRKIFKHDVKYKKFSNNQIQKILKDFEILTSCQDPYIENFIKKNPVFSNLHHLWTLNSHDYWTKLLKRELERRAH